MRGKVAKKLRKRARETSKPTDYKTKWFKFLVPGKSDDNGKPVYDYRGTVTCTGYRRVYQFLKSKYKEGPVLSPGVTNRIAN